ncbi:retrovirus-related pol polyprotein from transposon TNT 1-94, partial [Tanacetum coccineum]
ESELASLFGKLKYEENLINSIYDTNQEKTLVPTTPLSTVFFSSSIVQDFQDSPDDEEDLRRSQYAKATDQTECHKCGKKGHFARDCWSKTSVPSYQSHFQPKLLYSSKHKPEPRHTKDFEAKYNKVKAKPPLPSSKEVSSNDNDVTEVKAFMALVDEERVFVGKESARNGEWIKISMKSSGPKYPVFIKSSADNSEESVIGNNKPKLSKAKDSTLSNHDTGKVPSNESQRNITDHSVVVSNSSATDYDSDDESSVCSTPLPLLEKLIGVEPVSGPKTIKLILKSKSTFKTKTLKGITINKPSSAPARGNKSSSVSKTNSVLAGKLKNVKMEDDPPLAIVMKELNELKLQISKNKSSYFRNKNS